MHDVAYSSDGSAVHYDALGAGSPALVLVHGWSCDRTYWVHQVGHFAASRQVVAIDLAGHGESGVGRPSWTMPAFGDDVVAVVDRLGLARMVLIGHSMGGDVIVEAARQLGDRVIGLLWVDTYDTLDEPLSHEGLVAFMEPFRADFVAKTRDFVRGMFLPGADAELVERIAADMSAAPPAIALDALEHSFGNDEAVLEGIRAVNKPVIAINPEQPPTDVEGLRRHGVETVSMADVGHFPMLEAPEQFNDVLEATIERFGT